MCATSRGFPAGRHGDGDTPTRLVRALWLSTATFIVAMIAVAILAFTPAGKPSSIGLAQPPDLCPVGGCLPNSCPSLVHTLFAGSTTLRGDCAAVDTDRTLAVAVVSAIAVGPLGLSMMWAFCWCLSRAGRVTEALTAQRPKPIPQEPA